MKSVHLKYTIWVISSPAGLEMLVFLQLPLAWVDTIGKTAHIEPYNLSSPFPFVSFMTSRWAQHCISQTWLQGFHPGNSHRRWHSIPLQWLLWWSRGAFRFCNRLWQGRTKICSPVRKLLTPNSGYFQWKIKWNQIWQWRWKAKWEREKKKRERIWEEQKFSGRILNLRRSHSVKLLCWVVKAFPFSVKPGEIHLTSAGCVKYPKPQSRKQISPPKCFSKGPSLGGG